jgi:hypothetical protein
VEGAADVKEAPRAGAKLTDAEAAAHIAVAVEDADREALLEAIRSSEAASGLGEDIIQQMADMLLEG